MRGHKIVVGSRGGTRKNKSVAGVVNAGVAAGGSPSVSGVGKDKSSQLKAETLPACIGCGNLISSEVRALQCDRCLKDDVWKCAECLNIPGEVYDSLIECKELNWYCNKCGVETSNCVAKGEREDRLIGMMEKVLDKMTNIETRLHEKAEVKMVVDLEDRIRALEEKFKENEKELASVGKQVVNQNELYKDKVNGSDKASGEDGEIEKRRRNIVIYRLPEIRTEVADDRKCGDMAFIHEMCNDALKIKLESGDIEQMYRLGKFEEGKTRPLLVKFEREDKKWMIMRNLKELKLAQNDKYKGISVAHDLTWRQREAVREVRERAREELDEELKGKEEGVKENYRIIVVGQTRKPKAIRIPIIGL
jgi:hypothetical protein